jgi:hypothetical protein
MTTVAESQRPSDLPARLIIEAICTTCGPLEDISEGLEVVNLACAHTSTTGHVVVLNGTTDVAGDDDG